ncbi:MAG TPA: hypothetical protein VHY91_19250 [Pirellulales bacterium]|jgi:hypothetical protein|nr:hypothetical protein [Pirellulales bacterium]
MASQRWRDRLFEELHRQGLPSSYVSRLVDELTDHAADLLRENPSMDAEQNADARLGTPEHLAAVARAEFGRRTFAGRHPLLTFLVGPIMTVVATLIGTILVLWVSANSLFWLVDTVMGGSLSAIEPKIGPPSTPSLYHGVDFRCYSLIMRFFPFVASTWIFVSLGRQSGQRLWGLAACGLIASIAFVFSAVVSAETARHKALLLFCLNLSGGFNQILQAAVPLAFGVWMLWRSSGGPSKNVRGSMVEGNEHGKPALA